MKGFERMQCAMSEQSERKSFLLCADEANAETT